MLIIMFLVLRCRHGEQAVQHCISPSAASQVTFPSSFHGHVPNERVQVHGVQHCLSVRLHAAVAALQALQALVKAERAQVKE